MARVHSTFLSAPFWFLYIANIKLNARILHISPHFPGLKWQQTIICLLYQTWFKNLTAKKLYTILPFEKFWQLRQGLGRGASTFPLNSNRNPHRLQWHISGRKWSRRGDSIGEELNMGTYVSSCKKKLN